MASQAEEDQNLSSVNPLALQNNKQVLSRFRIICALFAGSAAGVLGSEGFPGFGLFFLQHALCSALLVLKTAGTPGKYFYYGWQDVLLSYLLASETFMTYLLLWTVFFNLCHIF